MIELITIVGITGKQFCGRAACRYMYASSKSLLANFHASRARLLLRYTPIKEPGWEISRDSNKKSSKVSGATELLTWSPQTWTMPPASLKPASKGSQRCFWRRKRLLAAHADLGQPFIEMLSMLVSKPLSVVAYRLRSSRGRTAWMPPCLW